jgi:hypothetical protein
MPGINPKVRKTEKVVKNATSELRHHPKGSTIIPLREPNVKRFTGAASVII